MEKRCRQHKIFYSISTDRSRAMAMSSKGEVNHEDDRKIGQRQGCRNEQKQQPHLHGPSVCTHKSEAAPDPTGPAGQAHAASRPVNRNRPNTAVDFPPMHKLVARSLLQRDPET
nr:hypothetical protein CFP56_22253 [Quercus suber]